MPTFTKDQQIIYYYRGKPYQILYEAKIKACSLIETYTSFPCNFLPKWADVVVYKCLYKNDEGMVWVRERTEFFNLFKPIDQA